MQLNGDASDLTKEQKDLLRLLVEKHESTGGAEFNFVRSSGGAGLCYRGPVSVYIPYDESDFNQLQRENLITLIFVDIGQFRGKPTQRGINLVQNGFTSAADLTGPPLALSRIAPRGLDWAPTQVDAPAPKQPQTSAEFLASFPRAVGSAVEAEEIRAERAFVAEQNASGDGKVEEFARSYIMRVFLVFARAICKLGLNGQFEIREIEATCRRFLRLLAAEVYRDKVWCNRGALGKSLMINSEHFKQKLESFEKTPEWGQYKLDLSAAQDKLLADLDRQATSEPQQEPDIINAIDPFDFTQLDVGLLQEELDGDEAESLTSNEEQDTAEAEAALEIQPNGISGNVERTIKAYEYRCPLLADTALEQLRHGHAQRDKQLHRQIHLGETQLRERQEELRSGVGKEGVAENMLRQEIKAIREEIVDVGMTVAADGVCGFANGLLASQGRLGVHANWLREYTALLVNEIRDRLGSSRVFQLDPLLPWAQDPITQKAIQTCEAIIAERRTTGDRWPYGLAGSTDNNPAWALVVQAWEAFKASNNIRPTPSCERIPESFLRNFLAGHYGIKDTDVDWEQIRLVGADLCRHYARVLVVPADFVPARPARTAPVSKATAQFWKEREDEFRAHDSPANCTLSATWFSIDERWAFRSNSGGAAATSEAQQVFKALAREAAKGLAGSRSPDLWLDWLDALRRATDRSTGRCLYSKVSSSGSQSIGERQLDQMAKLGEPVPPGGLIDFLVPADREHDVDASQEPVGPSEARAEKRMFWETSTESIEFLFRTSARYCLELRSLTPDLEEKMPGQPGAIPPQQIAKEQVMEPVNAIQQTEQDNPELRRRRERQSADSNAMYRRYLGRNPLEAERQEELLRDARHYVLGRLAQAVRDLELPHHASEADIEAACDEIRDRFVSQAWENIREFERRKKRSDFHLNSQEFEAALWTEDFPSLQERSLAAIQDAVRRRGGDESGLVAVDPSGAGTTALQPPVTGNPTGETPARSATVGNDGNGAGASALSWDVVEICFLDAEHAQVTVPGKVTRLSYAEMGFGDRRGVKVGDRGPTKGWGWLRKLAQDRGVIDLPERQRVPVPKGPRDAERQPTSSHEVLVAERAGAARAREQLQVAMKELRRSLQSHFCITDNPILFEETRYRVQFKIGCSSSYHQ